MISERKTRQSRPRSLMVLIFIEGLSSFCGFLGGIPLIANPSGAILGLPLSMLSLLPIPIHDFLLPGLWLFFVYGVGFAAVTYLLWSGNHRAWSLALTLCVVWLGWITFEVIFLGPSPLITVWYIPQVSSLIVLTRPNVRSSRAISRTGSLGL